jgi:hypothetical protein
MKLYGFFFLILCNFLMFCHFKVEKKYPNEIVKYGLINQYDIAKFETYKLISGLDCDCLGVADSIIENRDSLNLISQDLKLHDFSYHGDSFVLSFVFVDQYDTRLLSVQQNYGDCFNYISFVFHGDKIFPSYALIDDLYHKLPNDHYWDSLYIRSIKEYRAKGKPINLWLGEYLLKHQM